MAFLTQFKLGRPNREALFEINPSALSWNGRKLVDTMTGMDGTLNAATLSRDRPKIRLDGNYITPTFWNQLRALRMIDDTMLVFEPFNDALPNVWESWTERVVPTSLTTIPIPDNSALRGSALRVAAGGASCVDLIGLWDDIPLTAGREGTGPSLFDYGPASYSFGFEPPTYIVADLNTQDSWSVSGSPADLKVTATNPLTGLQSVKLISGGNPTGLRSFFAALTAPYEVEFQMRWFATGNTDFMSVIARDLGPADRWTVRIRTLAGVERLQLDRDGATSVYDAPFVQAAPYRFRVRVVGTALSFFYNDVLIASATLATSGTYQSILLRGAPTSGEDPSGMWDQIIHHPLTGSASYADATRTITLTGPLPNLNPRYLTYRSGCFAVHLREVPATTKGGWVDAYRYDLELEGA